MSLVLTAYGTSRGYAISKLCDIDGYLASGETFSKTCLRSSDPNDGYVIGTKTLPNNNDNQGLPGNPSTSNIAMLAGNYTHLFGAEAVENPSFPGVQGAGYELVIAPLTTLVGDTNTGITYHFLPPDVIGLSGTSNQTAAVDYSTGKFYLISTVRKYPVASEPQGFIVTVYDPTTGTISKFVETPRVDISSILQSSPGFGFNGDASTVWIAVAEGSSGGSGPATTTLTQYRAGDGEILWQEVINVVDTSLYPAPQYVIAGIAFLRGVEGNKIILSGTRHTELLASRKFIAEMDLDTLVLQEVALGESKSISGSTGQRPTSLQTFGLGWGFIYDWRNTLDAQMTRLSLPSGETVGNNPSGDPPQPDDDGWEIIGQPPLGEWGRVCGPGDAAFERVCAALPSGWERNCR